MEQRRLLDPAIYQEITRRAAGGKQHVSWARYLLLVSACADVVSAAPETVEECEQFSAEEQISDDLVRIAGVINLILSNGIGEFAEYLSEAARRAKHRQAARSGSEGMRDARSKA